MKQTNQQFVGVWSATPTPLTPSLEIDVPSVSRLVEHHIRMGVSGLFLGGTCGEGPLLSHRDLDLLTRTAAVAAGHRIKISVQVTDISYARVLENIKRAGDNGAEIGVVGEPMYEIPLADNAWRDRYYREILENSVLPIGFYVRQDYLSEATYHEMISHPNTLLIKDSSTNDKLMKLFVKQAAASSRIVLLTGDELHVSKYLQAGYNGILSGGCIVTGLILRDIIEAAKNNDYQAVAELQEESDHLLCTIYGGEKFSSWLTGLKYALKLMGIFSHETNYAEYPLGLQDRLAIEQVVKSSKRLIQYEQDHLISTR